MIRSNVSYIIKWVYFSRRRKMLIMNTFVVLLIISFVETKSLFGMGHDDVSHLSVDFDTDVSEDYIRIERGLREAPPDIYLVTPIRNNTRIKEFTHDNITYKQVDITDDIIHIGLNRNVYLTHYLENATSKDFKLVIRDRTPIYPFQYSLGNNRSVVFVVDNDRLSAHFSRERRALLRMASNVNQRDDRRMHNFLYRLGGVLDDTDSLRHSYMRKIIRALSRNRVQPIYMTIESLEKELADAAVIEFSLRQLDQEAFDNAPLMIQHKKFLADRIANNVTRPPDGVSGLEVILPDFIESDGEKINITGLADILRGNV